MTATQERIRQLAGQFAPRASRFLCWWRDSLRAWLPPRWQWALGWSPARLLLREEHGALQVASAIGSNSSPPMPKRSAAISGRVKAVESPALDTRTKPENRSTTLHA